MGIPKSMAVAVSGLTLAGGAALGVMVATPASSASVQTTVAAPQQALTGCQGGCRGRGCCTRSSNHNHFRQFRHHHYRNHDRAIIVNRNQNFSRSRNDQFQRQLEQQRQRIREEEEQNGPRMNANAAQPR
ncbi:hypothetical protein [Actinomadura alba]|uniref:Uncharacterized protein n=1 Tax=Actinomadura alba TaxID=406431 RepID=A0ABR7LZT7_9ACTN|nr:hypothetical protein [Actinomadura alba]MBC6470372.1 hypothetical protein [Actinomadura alba]